MRICLIAETFPASSSDSSADRYLSGLANGLAEAGNEVTVLRMKPGVGANFASGIKAITVDTTPRSSRLKLVGKVSPKAYSRLGRYLDYWHCLKETLAGSVFDVFEASQSNAGALLPAFTRETPTVIRLEQEAPLLDSGFDGAFENMFWRYAFASVDAFSTASQNSRESWASPYANRIFVNEGATPAALAEQALVVYERARHEFDHNLRPNLYRHGSDRLLKSTEDMLSLYDKMLYDLLFCRSYRFRIRHWLHVLCCEPERFMRRARAKLGMKV